jgi:nucleoside-diphosphate-sugar epimerase
LRDYVYIEDLYKIIKYAVRKKIGTTVNAATGKSYPISAIARIVRSALPIDADIVAKPKPSGKSEKRVQDLVFDQRRFTKIFHGLKLLDLKDGIPVYLKNTMEEQRKYKKHTALRAN